MWNKLPDALTGGRAQDAVSRAFGEIQQWYWAVQLTLLVLAFTLLGPGAWPGVAIAVGWAALMVCSAGGTALLAWSATRYPALQMQKDRQGRLEAIEQFAEAEHQRLEAEYEAAMQALALPKPRSVVITGQGPKYADSGLPYQAEPGRDYYKYLVKVLQLRPLGGEAGEFGLASLHLANNPAGRLLVFWVHALWLAECSSKAFRGWAVPEATEVLRRYQRIIIDANTLYPTTENRTVSLLQLPGACFLIPNAEMGARVAWLMQLPKEARHFQQHYVEWSLLAEQNNWDAPCVADLYYLMSFGGPSWEPNQPLDQRGYFPGTGNLDPEYTIWVPNVKQGIESAY